MFSKPMKAQGEIQAIRTTWFRALRSGRSMGSIVKPVPPSPAAAPRKQRMIPTERTTAMTTIMVMVIRLDWIHNRAMTRIAAMVSRASPR